MSAILTILIKDLRQRSRDGTLLLFALALPLGLAFMLNALLGGSSGSGEGGFTAEYTVVDEDGGDVATAFTEGVLGPLEDDGLLTVTTAATEDDGIESVESGDADAAFIIPSGFSDSLADGESVELTVIGSANAPEAVQVAREIGRAFAGEHRRIQLAVTIAAEGSDTDGAELAQRAGETAAPVTVEEDASAQRRELDTVTYYSAGTAFFFLFFAAMFSVNSIFEERGNGTLARLLAAPISRPGVLAAKLSSAVLVGIASMAILVIASSLLFGADWGAPLGVAALSVSGVLAAVGITAGVAGFAGNSEQALNWLSVIAMLLGVLGGALFPITQLGALSTLSYFTPHRWFLDGLANLSADGSVATVLTPVLVLLGMAAVGGGAALFRMGRMLHS
ncbi:ABC transporter permease [Nocardiopsis ansamitocini]|uniref:ABC-2 type transporter transmembrane domain-containing protein n=1 Tax=Nocardiopsis ansamitocini TaxID=1670832 RepID=A0A9W6PAK9_9ACTN|nr:ABC transporter permease [Nocardiopsis ansamitocini]GLU50017.1 hypothetical protein Nans01_43680 [Nocardiopsis ansamitocini]